jgi:myosin heavy subunit
VAPSHHVPLFADTGFGVSKASRRPFQAPKGKLTLCSRNLPSVGDDTVLATLRERYLNNLPYTSLSSTALVSVNPQSRLPLNSDESLLRYVDGYYKSFVDDSAPARDLDVSRPIELLEPHIFGLALKAYYNMRRTQQDQVIIMRQVQLNRPRTKLT